MAYEGIAGYTFAWNPMVCSTGPVSKGMNGMTWRDHVKTPWGFPTRARFFSASLLFRPGASTIRGDHDVLPP